jgi:hypothetical protein
MVDGYGSAGPEVVAGAPSGNVIADTLENVCVSAKHGTSKLVEAVPPPATVTVLGLTPVTEQLAARPVNSTSRSPVATWAKAVEPLIPTDWLVPPSTVTV